MENPLCRPIVGKAEIGRRMVSNNGGWWLRRSETSSGSWFEKVARNVRNSVRQKDSHYAQISRGFPLC